MEGCFLAILSHQWDEDTFLSVAPASSAFTAVSVQPSHSSFASAPYLGQGDLILCPDFYFLRWAIIPRDKEKISYHTTVWRYFCPPFHHWVSMLTKPSERRENGGVKHNLAMLCYSRAITVGRARWVHDVIYSDCPWRTLAACFILKEMLLSIPRPLLLKGRHTHTEWVWTALKHKPKTPFLPIRPFYFFHNVLRLSFLVYFLPVN